MLILSRLAGAAETMHEALQVNPYDIDTVATRLAEALTMPVEDRRDRMAALQERERRNNVRQWLDSYLEAAHGPVAAFRPPTADEFDAWLGRYLEGHPLALFLDFDGTLAPIVDDPAVAAMPDATRDALRRCAARGDTDVAIVSGRALEDVRARVDLETVAYAGNHGLEIRGPEFDDFLHADVRHFEDRVRELGATLERIRAPGASVEVKGASLTYHYRGVPGERWPELVARVEEEVRDAGFPSAECAVRGGGAPTHRMGQGPRRPPRPPLALRPGLVGALSRDLRGRRRDRRGRVPFAPRPRCHVPGRRFRESHPRHAAATGARRHPRSFAVARRAARPRGAPSPLNDASVMDNAPLPPWGNFAT